MLTLLYFYCQTTVEEIFGPARILQSLPVRRGSPDARFGRVGGPRRAALTRGGGKGRMIDHADERSNARRPTG